MTALGEGTEDTKRRISRAELDTDDEDTAVVLGELAAARLVTLDDTGIEIAHEALIRGWPRLREWLTQDREGLRVHRQLTEATDAWESVEEDPGWLYRGTRLAIAREWAARQDTALSQRERRFLDASLAVEARRTGARPPPDTTAAAARRAARGAAGRRRGRVRLRRARRDHGHRPAQQRARPEGRRPGAGHARHQPRAGRAARARRVPPRPEHRSAQQRARRFGAPYSTRLTGHTGRVNTVSLRPDGQVLATASWDGTARLWDIHDPHHPAPLGVLTGHTGNVNSVAFAADGRSVATAGLRRHRPRLGRHRPGPPGPGRGRRAAQRQGVRGRVRPGGPLLATGDVDGTLRSHNTTDAARLRPGGS